MDGLLGSHVKRFRIMVRLVSGGETQWSRYLRPWNVLSGEQNVYNQGLTNSLLRAL